VTAEELRGMRADREAVVAAAQATAAHLQVLSAAAVLLWLTILVCLIIVYGGLCGGIREGMP
jgi:hypothetical protein